jgi:hypothetical protein
MKKLLFLTVWAGSITVFSAEKTVTGVIGDSMCMNNHAMMQHGAKKLNAHDCTLACVKSGQKYVLSSGKKIYQIENQTFADLESNAGKKVKAIGQLSADGGTITLTKLTPASAH